MVRVGLQLTAMDAVCTSTDQSCSQDRIGADGVGISSRFDRAVGFDCPMHPAGTAS